MKPASLVRAAIAGAVFVVAQASLFRLMPVRPGIEHPAWFLNTVQGVGVMTSVFALLGLAMAVAGRPTVSHVAIPTAAGCGMAIAVTYSWLGGGNLFPIVVVVGTAFLGFAAVIGAWVGSVLRGRLGHEP